MNIRTTKKICCSLLLTCLITQNITASSISWYETFKNIPTSIYNWTQENKGKALIGGLAGCALTYACYQRYKNYYANTLVDTADTFLEALPLDLSDKQTITELFTPYRNRAFVNKQNQLIETIKTIPKNDHNNPLKEFNSFFFHFNEIQTEYPEYEHLLPSVTSTFYFYTLLAAANLINTNKKLYDPLLQNMFYVRLNGDNLRPYTLHDFKKENPGPDYSSHLINDWKVHLMPKKEEFIPVLLHLSKLLKNNRDFSKNIRSVKINPNYILDYDERIQKDSKDIIAGIIIYPLSTPKYTAQEVLDSVYLHFKDFKGNGVRPRFNGQVTDLIYIAQGNADEKLQEENREWFEQPNMIYYNNKRVGDGRNYHLNYPGTNIEITEPIRPQNLPLQ